MSPGISRRTKNRRIIASARVITETPTFAKKYLYFEKNLPVTSRAFLQPALKRMRRMSLSDKTAHSPSHSTPEASTSPLCSPFTEASQTTLSLCAGLPASEISFSACTSPDSSADFFLRKSSFSRSLRNLFSCRTSCSEVSAGLMFSFTVLFFISISYWADKCRMPTDSWSRTRGSYELLRRNLPFREREHTLRCGFRSSILQGVRL